MKIIWTANASNSYFKILDFLYFIWNEKIEEDFITLVNEIEILLISNPELGKLQKNDIREILLHKNASLYYKFNPDKQEVVFLLFKDNRQEPQSYLKLL